ncbi:hypothetical protein, partial [uncultured Parabacteroides sp.]|uniref:hypothetical protein n=1 Tax=uncultured Parabacteroides sp. TaxID=512312 RepID=UPI0025CFD204
KALPTLSFILPTVSATTSPPSKDTEHWVRKQVTQGLFELRCRHFLSGRGKVDASLRRHLQNVFNIPS